MSSFKKRQKTLKRAHKERSQLHSRQHLGLLEKHKDYVLRARDYEKKKVQLKRLHEKARNRNPDEFYYKMISQPLQGGKHVVGQKEEKYSEDDLLLMSTQDQKYVQMKLTQEGKKIDRLRSCLHQTQHKSNTHTVFVDSQEEVSQKVADLKQNKRNKKATAVGEVLTKENTSTSQLYKEFKSRSQRCKDLQRVCSQLKTKRDLLGKGTCVKIKSDEGSAPPTYKWRMERLK